MKQRHVKINIWKQIISSHGMVTSCINSNGSSLFVNEEKRTNDTAGPHVEQNSHSLRMRWLFPGSKCGSFVRLCSCRCENEAIFSHLSETKSHCVVMRLKFLDQLDFIEDFAKNPAQRCTQRIELAVQAYSHL